MFIERGRTKGSVTGRNPKLVISLTLLLGYGGHRHHGLCKTLRPNNRERSARHGSTAAPVAAPPSLGSGHRTHLFMPCALRRSSRCAWLVSIWFLSTLSNPASSSSSSNADASRTPLYNMFLFHRTVSLCNSRQLRDQSRQFKFWYPSIVLMCCEILSYSRAPQRIISNWYADFRNSGDPAASGSALVVFVDLGFQRWRISHVLFFFFRPEVKWSSIDTLLCMRGRVKDLIFRVRWVDDTIQASAVYRAGEACCVPNTRRRSQACGCRHWGERHSFLESSHWWHLYVELLSPSSLDPFIFRLDLWIFVATGWEFHCESLLEIEGGNFKYKVLRVISQ